MKGHFGDAWLGLAMDAQGVRLRAMVRDGARKMKTDAVE
jgi:hypothetical protein